MISLSLFFISRIIKSSSLNWTQVYKSFAKRDDELHRIHVKIYVWRFSRKCARDHKMCGREIILSSEEVVGPKWSRKPSARFSERKKERKRENRGRKKRSDRVVKEREREKIWRVRCTYYITVYTFGIFVSRGDADKWRVASFGHATPNWRYRDVTCRVMYR